MNLIVRALYQASIAYPYYTKGFMAMKIVETDKIPTAGVDKYWRLYINPKFAADNKYFLVAIMRHELEHLIREHSERINLRNHYKWNIACDIEINADIEELKKAGDYWTPDSIKCEPGKTAEFYYEKLPADMKAPECYCSEGSGVTGQEEEWEKGGDGANAIKDAAGEELKNSIAADIVQHEKSNPGTVPSGILVWAKAKATGKLPKIRWQNIVARKITEIINGREDFTFGKISRRQNGREKVILPATIRGIPSCAVVVDTSGSMSDLGDWVAGCMSDILKLFRNNVEFIAVDADVHNAVKGTSWKNLFKLRGGGGTDMRVGIDFALKRKKDLVIVLTDGETPWPEKMDKRVIPVIKEHKYGN